MTELEKLEAGLPYDFRDPEVDARKLHAVKMCKVLNETDPTDYPACEKAIRELFGSVGKNPVVLPRVNCDNGKNIHVGDDFLTNYNVTILDSTRYDRRPCHHRTRHADHHSQSSFIPVRQKKKSWHCKTSDDRE